MKNYNPEIHKTILRLPDVLKIVKLSRTTIYSLMAKEDFPKHISLGTRAVGWLESDIQDWLEQRIQASTANSKKRANHAK